MSKKRAIAAPQQGSEQATPGSSESSRQDSMGNAQLQEMMHGDAEATGFKGDPADFRARMEGAFGQSFSNVQLVGGMAGEAGVSSGAVATAQGNTIWVGALFAELGATEQEEILAHEYAHVAQASGTDETGGDPEADANNAAGLALSGQRAETTTGVSSGSSHNFDIGQALSNVGDAAIDLALRQIATAADFLAFIARFGEAAATTAINFLAEHRVDILLAALSVVPGQALLIQIVRALPTEAISDYLRSQDPAVAARLVAALVQAGATNFISGPLFSLGPPGLSIISQLGGPIIALLWAYAPEEMKTMARTRLVEGWPVGLGLELEGSIGATFGYPVYLGAEAFFSVSHLTEGNFQLRRGGIMTEALDTGVGAGGFLGIGGRAGRGGSGEGGIGIGAEAGAQAQAGLKQVVLQEFMFPMVDDNAFASFMVTVLQNDAMQSSGILGTFGQQLPSINPISYNTMTKVEMKAFAEGTAMAQAGVRTAGENTQQGRGTWTNRDGARDNGSPKWWQRWMRVGGFARLAAEVTAGAEVRNTEFTTDEEGVRVPSVMEVDVYGEGSAALSITHAFPVISAALPQANFDGGAGIKVTHTIRGTPTDEEPQSVSAPTWQLYVKSGDLDRYNGAASETAISVGNLSADTFESVETFLASITAGSYFKRRFSVGSQLGRKYFRAAQRQGAFNVMLPAEYRSYGFRIEGYLDLDSQLTADMVRSIFRSIISGVDEYASGGEPLQRLYNDISTFLATGQAPANIVAHATQIANTVLSGITKLHLHGLVGLSVAAGGKLSTGAKLRLEGRLGAQITMDHDLLAAVGGSITLDDIRQLMESGLDQARGELEVEGTE